MNEADTIAAGVSDAPGFLAGGGAMGALMRARDWSETPLGPPGSWPQALRTTVSTCLNCSFPILIWWGPELIKLYNDAYAEIIAAKHPAALGTPGRLVWPEIWDTIGPMLNQVLNAGEATAARDLPLTLHRNGYPEACFFSFSYSPIRDETGAIAGVFCPVVETTPRVLAERRARFLLSLESALRSRTDAAGARRMAAEMLGQHLNLRQAFYAEIPDGSGRIVADGMYSDGSPFAGLDRLDELGAAYAEKLRQGRSVTCTDAAAAKLEGAWLAVPVLRDEVLTAVMVAVAAAPHSWSAHDIGIVQDVTERTWRAVERARVESALRRSEEEFRALGENLPNLCWLAAPDGYLYWYNRRWHDYTGKTLADMEGWGWESVHDPDVLPHVKQRWKTALATGEPFEMTFPLLGADGRFRQFLTRVAPVRDAGGAIARWVGTNVDITELRDAEERLRASEGKLRQLNETLEQQVAARTADRDRIWRLSTDVMLVARVDSTITAANPAWKTLLGWEEDDLVGRSFLDFIHPDDLAATRDETEALASGEPTLRFDNRYRHKDGSYRWLSWTAVPHKGLIHGVGRDMTAAREAAAQLDAARDRLRQSQRLEALGQLAGGIAHDFNNVLQAVSGGLSLIRRRAKDPEAVGKFAEMAEHAAARGAAVAGRLLAFARKDGLAATSVEPGALLEGLREILTHTIGANIRIVTLWAGAPPLLVDRAQLETVLINLAVNARDAMQNGGTLTIAVEAETEAGVRAAGLQPGCYARLTVSDTGSGMDSRTLSRAGDPFFTTKPLGRGTGLGLAMARGFASQSNGGFGIASMEGQGTTVTLWLPQAEAAAVPDRLPEPVPAMPQSLRILLVDDEPSVRDVLAAHLLDRGFTVDTASDGLAALARLDGGIAPDLLVTDFAMPGMNGLVLLGEARRRLPGLPTVLLTGFADPSLNIADASVSGPTVLLRKPVSGDALASSALRLRAPGES